MNGPSPPCYSLSVRERGWPSLGIPCAPGTGAAFKPPHPPPNTRTPTRPAEAPPACVGQHTQSPPSPGDFPTCPLFFTDSSEKRGKAAPSTHPPRKLRSFPTSSKERHAGLRKPAAEEPQHGGEAGGRKWGAQSWWGGELGESVGEASGQQAVVRGWVCLAVSIQRCLREAHAPIPPPPPRQYGRTGRCMAMAAGRAVVRPKQLAAKPY